MDIFILGGDEGVSNSFFYQCIKAFKDLGHNVEYFNYRKHRLHKIVFSNKLLNKFILKKVTKLNPDILLVIKGESIPKGIIKGIGSKGIITINWTLDEPFGRIYSMNKIKNIF